MRNANIAYAIEVLNGRLNGSSETVEVNKSGNKNTSYVKKIAGRGLVSGNCQKYNMIKYLEDVGKFEISKRKKTEKEVFSKTLPHKYVNEDLFGFMKAQNIVITEEEYQSLDEIEQSLFVKNGKKGYKQNITKKRMSRVHLSSLVNISNTKINTEFKVTTTDTENMLYNVETYSGLMAGIANIDIENIVVNITNNYGVELPKKERAQVVKLMSDINKLDYNYNDMKESLNQMNKNLKETLKEMGKEIKESGIFEKLWNKIKEFFSWIGDLFKGDKSSDTNSDIQYDSDGNIKEDQVTDTATEQIIDETNTNNDEKKPSNEEINESKDKENNAKENENNQNENNTQEKVENQDSNKVNTTENKEENEQSTNVDVPTSNDNGAVTQ